MNRVDIRGTTPERRLHLLGSRVQAVCTESNCLKRLITVDNIENVVTEVRKIKLSDIVFREDIYARIEKDQSLISKYADNAEMILKSHNRIVVSQDNILIDGWHRWKAFERVYGKDVDIDVDVFMTDNIDVIEMKSYSIDEAIGKSHTKAETTRNVQRLYSKGHSRDAISNAFSISTRWVNEATKQQRATEKEENERTAVDMYLHAGNTQQSIADELGVSQQTILRIIDNIHLGSSSQMDKEWNLSSKDANHDSTKPFRYNIWNMAKQDNQNDARCAPRATTSPPRHHTDCVVLCVVVIILICVVSR